MGGLVARTNQIYHHRIAKERMLLTEYPRNRASPQSAQPPTYFLHRTQLRARRHAATPAVGAKVVEKPGSRSWTQELLLSNS